MAIGENVTHLVLRKTPALAGSFPDGAFWPARVQFDGSGVLRASGQQDSPGRRPACPAIDLDAFRGLPESVLMRGRAPARCCPERSTRDPIPVTAIYVARLISWNAGPVVSETLL